jgi:hypothetical protein
VSEIRKAIEARQRLTRMRLGQSSFEYIEFPGLSAEDGTPVRFAQVPLTEAEVQAGVTRAARIAVDDNMAGVTLRNRVANVSDVWHSLRDPHDLQRKAFESEEEMAATLEPTDIDLAVDSLAMLMDYASPSLDGFSAEGLEELKKAFETVEWSELSGREWAAVKLCCQRLGVLSHLGRSSGSTSTDSSMRTSADVEPTSTA